MNVPRLLRGAARVGSGITGVGAFAVFAMAAMQDHTATAAAAAGLCLALAVLAALDLESFEGLGIKAKLRTTLSDAEARLDSLDAIIRSLARGAFVQAARGNLTNNERRAMVDEMTAALQQMNMSAETINVLKRPFFSYVASCLWYVATSVRSNYLTGHVRPLEQQEYQLPLGAERDEIRTERERLSSVLVVEHPYNDNFERFRPIAERMATEMPIVRPDHRQTFLLVVGEISDLFEECVRTGNLTDRAINVIGDPSVIGNPFVEAWLARFK